MTTATVINPPLPAWITAYRDHQTQAIEEVIDAFNRGVKVVMLDAPTGSGKTLIGETVRRELGGQALYTCSTKTLQDQFVHDFDYARMIKGRSNYPTQLYPARFHDAYATRLSCDDCTGVTCGLCETTDDCPYQKAKGRALASPVAVLNTAYMLGEGQGGHGQFARRDLVIVDEADLLENSLMGYVEVRISRRMQGKLGISRPGKKTVKEAWLEWGLATLPKIAAGLSRAGDEKERKAIARLQQSVTRLVTDLGDNDRGDWVYTDYDSDAIVFRPVKVDQVAQDVLWTLGERFLLMSASLISGHQMAEDLGLEEGEWETVTVANTFPVENRPILLAPIGKMTMKEYDTTLPKVVKAVQAVVREHPGENVLVHTVSYKLAKDLSQRFPGSLTYTNGDDRERVLTRFKEDGGIIFAPSLDRGVDLPGDLCRVQVIVKVPFPYLGDKQVQARLYSKGGQVWYQVQTIRTLIQMTGRGVRSKDDSCTTYILDSAFIRLFKEAGKLFPPWWSEALDWTGEAKKRLTK